VLRTSTFILYGELRDRPAAAGVVLAASLLLLAAIAFADYITGYEIRLAILYLLPIAIGLWYPIVVAIMTLIIGTLFLKETRHRDIHHNVSVLEGSR